jgi:hypothetical protein
MHHVQAFLVYVHQDNGAFGQTWSQTQVYHKPARENDAACADDRNFDHKEKWFTSILKSFT